MTTSPIQTLTLEAFLQLPNLEESPAWEYLEGVALQKPMPKTRHSILQKRLLNVIDAHTTKYTALPELRCTFGGRSIVPDVAVVAWERLPVNAIGVVEDDFTQAPDWTIEILSPDQKATRVIDNILHCLRHHGQPHDQDQGQPHDRHHGQLGWLIDPDDRSILIFAPQQEPDVCRGDRPLRVLAEVDLELTAEQVFGWLQVGQR